MISTATQDFSADLILPSLATFDTSAPKRLEIMKIGPLSDDLHQALLSMKNLRILRFSICVNQDSFTLALFPDPNSANPIPCPKLERLVVRTEAQFDVKTLVEVAAARMSRGVPLESVRLINRGEPVTTEGLTELLNHVSHLETSFEISDPDNDILKPDDDSDQEDWWEGLRWSLIVCSDQ